jgi:hypothetical protein
MKPELNIAQLCLAALQFAELESAHVEPVLFGITDGKAVGTYLEHKFQVFLTNRYETGVSSSAKGIDLPTLNVDIKVTSIKQPQSSCPFKSARQKVYGLGYNLLIFVYDKRDDPQTQTSQLNILHVTFVAAEKTADYQTTSGIHQLLANNGNADDIAAFLLERYLPVDEVQAYQLAEEIVATPPEQGYLTISNALQWRLQYRRVIEAAGEVAGIQKIL